MKRKWIIAWAVQIGEMLVVGLVAALSQQWGPVPRGVMLWGVAPIGGLFSACRAVRRGLNNYLAWLAPPPCLYATNYLLWGYAPPAGPALLAALCALVGAAAGEVLAQRSGRRRHRRNTRS